MREAIPPLPNTPSMVWCLVKHTDNFTFLPLPLTCRYTSYIFDYALRINSHETLQNERNNELTARTRN